MFGKFLSKVLDVATFPLDVVNTGTDLLTGGDGSKESRKDNIILGDLEELRDSVSESLKELDN